MTDRAQPFDAALFSPDAIPAEVKALNERLEALIATAPAVNERTPQEVRAERAQGRGTFPKPQLSAKARTRTIEGPAGPLTLRLFVPEHIDGIYFHIHGGGWTLGSSDGQDPMLERLSQSCRLAVVSVEYRLAPEAPYPAAPDDCEAAGLWILRHARREFDCDRLIIGGESAGAHLAVVTLARLKERHGIKDFAGANLCYGMYDLSGTPSARNWGKRNLILSTPIITWFVGNYVPLDHITSEKLKNPDISPLYADLADMPEALFTVGTLDPLIDDTLFLHGRWTAAGRPAELAVYPGGVHGFNALPNALGAEANARIEGFLKRVGRPARADAAPSLAAG
ncbi:MAG: alpha/beta hydrolase fold domain-containing protein [Alphaproteobacteria bacterium]|nr:alpha/beta hydrolase fold domain-containing protein [Alphaproteobacteria bacterium]